MLTAKALATSRQRTSHHQPVFQLFLPEILVFIRAGAEGVLSNTIAVASYYVSVLIGCYPIHSGGCVRCYKRVFVLVTLFTPVDPSLVFCCFRMSTIVMVDISMGSTSCVGFYKNSSREFDVKTHCCSFAKISSRSTGL